MPKIVENDEQKSITQLSFEYKLLDEIKKEHQISPFREDDESLINYMHEGMIDINENNGVTTNYDEDLLSRRLLKLYVLYADHKRIAEFKSMYVGEYAERQRYYFQKSCSSI